ncbi:hypothetical protein MRX96_019242 [Rhipicephalus microplus]
MRRSSGAFCARASQRTREPAHSFATRSPAAASALSRHPTRDDNYTQPASKETTLTSAPPVVKVSAVVTGSPTAARVVRLRSNAEARHFAPARWTRFGLTLPGSFETAREGKQE